jgi:aminomethyltransferase
MTSPGSVYHLALREVHAAAGATFVVRAGWSQPARYTGLEVEHRAIRTAAAAFDRSARSRFLVSGTDAAELLAAAFAGHIDELEEGRAMRTLRLDGAGEIRDLVLIARTGGIAYLVSGEPGQRHETAEALAGATGADFDVRVDDRTESTCLVGVAGPRAADVFREHLAEALPARLQLLHCVAFEFHGFRALATRTSDVGEDGFELMVAPAVGQHIFETLTAAGIQLAGLEALEATRIESCIPAFEPDLSTGLSPGEAGLDGVIGVPPGRARWALSAVMLDGEIMLPTGSQLRTGGKRVGELRSVVRSPLVGGTIGLAVTESAVSAPGTRLDASGTPATIVAKPFYRRRSSP